MSEVNSSGRISASEAFSEWRVTIVRVAEGRREEESDSAECSQESKGKYGPLVLPTLHLPTSSPIPGMAHHARKNTPAVHPSGHSHGNEVGRAE